MIKRDVAEMSADALWLDWQRWIEIIRWDTTELFMLRRQFREIRELYNENAHLERVGANLYVWMLTLYGSTVLMRVRREVSGQRNSVDLHTLLWEIQKRPDVITRSRIIGRVPDRDEMLTAVVNENFSEHWISPHRRGSNQPTDHIDRADVTADRERLEQATDRLVDVASRTIAHRTPTTDGSVKITEADAVIDLIGDLTKKYVLLLTGAAIVNMEPTPQYDTAEVFTFPWHPNAFAQWQRLVISRKES